MTPHKVLLAVLVAALAWYATSCAALYGILGGGAGAAAGAVVAGPVGAGVGGAAGAGLGSSLGENSDLRDGTLVGEDALEKELRRWKGEALAAKAQVDYLERAKWIAIGLLVLAFLWRNRAHILAFGPGWAERVWHALWGGPLRGAETNTSCKNPQESHP